MIDRRRVRRFALSGLLLVVCAGLLFVRWQRPQDTTQAAEFQQLDITNATEDAERFRPRHEPERARAESVQRSAAPTVPMTGSWIRVLDRSGQRVEGIPVGVRTPETRPRGASPGIAFSIFDDEGKPHIFYEDGSEKRWLPPGERPYVPQNEPTVQAESTPVWSALTDAHGMVEVPERYRKAAGLLAVFDFPTLDDPSAPFEKSVHEARVANLILPDVVRQELHLIDDLPGNGAKTFRGRLIHRRGVDDPRWFARDRLAELPSALHVVAERGVELQLACYLERPFSPWLRIPLPTQPTGDDTARIDVRSSSTMAHATVRMLQRNGDPARAGIGCLTTLIAKAAVRARRRTMERLVGVLPCQSDGEFGFVFEADTTAFQRRYISIAPFDPRTSDEARGTPPGARTRDALEDHAFTLVPTNVPPGSVLHLGTIAVGMSPVLVAGDVVDPSSRPIAAAKVTVRLDPHGDMGQRLAWTDERGAFRVTGLAPWDELLVEVDAEGSPLTRWKAVPTGTVDLHCVLVQSGRVQLHVSVPHPGLVERRVLHAVLRSASDDELREEPIAEPSGVSIERVRPGEYTIWLVLHGTPLSQPTNITVRPGETTDCRSLATLDLQRLVVPVEVRAVDGSGTAIADLRLQISGHDHEHRGTSPIQRSSATGEQTFFAPARWTHLELIRGETETTPIARTRGLQTVRMR